MRVLTQTVVLCVVLFLSGVSVAAEYHVNQDGSGDFTRIQEAIDAAQDGDTVIVHPATYYENVRFEGRNIVLTSEDPEDPQTVASTIIDGRGKASVIVFAGVEDESCKLTGFTITNGLSRDGGGIMGGREHKVHSLASITNCVISGNAATFGAGVCGCDGRIEACEIRDNYASSQGGGLYDCRGEIVRCVVAENRADSYAGAAGACDGLFINCLICDNSAQTGGAISGWQRRSPTIKNCTIAGNIAEYGGGLYDFQGEVFNSIIWGNWAPAGPNVSGYHSFKGYYSCIGGWHGEGIDNISDDPLYADPVMSDYHLSAGSPCIDTGDNSYVVGLRDVGGGPRIINRNIDIGAYEYPAGCYVFVEADKQTYGTDETAELSLQAGSYDADCLVDIYGAIRVPGGELLFIPSLSTEMTPWMAGVSLGPGSTFADTFDYELAEAAADAPYVVFSAVYEHGSMDYLLTDISEVSFTCRTDRPIRYEVKKDGSGDFKTIQKAIDTARDGDTVIVHPGSYYENIEVSSKNLTLRSTAPADSEIVERTVIDGTQTGSVVTFGARVDERFVLSGFTITNGQGAGISGLKDIQDEIKARATIKNCIVRDNKVGYYRDGAGIFACDGPIENCTVENNAPGGLVSCDGTIANCVLSGNYAEYGGGLCDCDGDIVGCLITGNKAGWCGGGISGCDGRIISCTIADNQTTRWPEHTPFGGGGIYACDGLFANCLIYDNYTECYGGGVWSSNGTFRNCIFWGNEASYSYGGICGFNTPSLCYPTIVNCTFVNNDGAVSDCFGPIRNCIIWNNPRGDTGVSDAPDINYCCISNWNWTDGGVGNISDDPMFVPGPFGDYYLEPNSPCIDAGSQSAEEAGVSDRTTQADGTPDTGIVDMGYHYLIPEPEVDVEVSCSLNADEFAPGDLLQGYLAVQNEGVEATVDIFVRFLLPDGSIYSWTDTGIALGIWPWMGDVTLPEGFSFGPEMIFELMVPGNLQPGRYSYAAAIALSASPYDFICIDSAHFNVN